MPVPSTPTKKAEPWSVASIDRNVWALGFVSLFMDLSSEMIHSLLPLYLVSVLGVSTLAVGLIEGIAESTASITKIFSGALSDYIGKRKLLAALGYGLSALTKPFFPLASTIGWLIAARFVDRLGKGIRGAPRDALVADVTPEALRGTAYGLRQAMDTIGAFLGPLLAFVIMLWTANRFKVVFWCAVIPAFIAITVMIVAVREPILKRGTGSGRVPICLSDLKRLSLPYWEIVAIGAILSLARFSEAFLLLRAQNLGLKVAFAPLVLVLMNIIYAGAAYPAGRWSDRIDRRRLLGFGFLVLIASDLALATASNLYLVAVGIALWGLHMAITQGLFATLVAAAAPAEFRGTAFGMFNLVSGVAMLVASILAGALWNFFGPAMTFFSSAILTGSGFIALLLLSRSKSK